MGLISPSHGLIKIDDITLNKSNIKLWHKHIAHVPQEIYLSDNSITENIHLVFQKKKLIFVM